MDGKDDGILDKVYAARTDAEREAAYDAWANRYDADVFGFGYRIPGVVAAVFGRFVDTSCAPILDAGCGRAAGRAPCPGRLRPLRRHRPVP